MQGKTRRHPESRSAVDDAGWVDRYAKSDEYIFQGVWLKAGRERKRREKKRREKKKRGGEVIGCGMKKNIRTIQNGMGRWQLISDPYLSPQSTQAGP